MKRLSEEHVSLIASRARALGEPVRVRIIEALSRGEQAVGQLAASLSMQQSTASKHLQVLFHAGLVHRRKGRERGHLFARRYGTGRVVPLPQRQAARGRRTQRLAYEIRTLLGASLFSVLARMRMRSAVQDGTVRCFVRHGHTEAVGPPAGGSPARNSLTPRGHAQATALAARLAECPIAAVYSQPTRACGRDGATGRLGAWPERELPRRFERVRFRRMDGTPSTS